MLLLAFGPPGIMVPAVKQLQCSARGC